MRTISGNHMQWLKTDCSHCLKYEQHCMETESATCRLIQCLLDCLKTLHSWMHNSLKNKTTTKKKKNQQQQEEQMFS